MVANRVIVASLMNWLIRINHSLGIFERIEIAVLLDDLALVDLEGAQARQIYIAGLILNTVIGMLLLVLLLVY